MSAFMHRCQISPLSVERNIPPESFLPEAVHGVQAYRIVSSLFDPAAKPVSSPAGNPEFFFVNVAPPSSDRNTPSDVPTK